MQNKASGLTLIEVLVVAPIVMLVIGVFIGMIIYLTGDVISSRVNNTQSYTIQDALDRIEQDVKLSAGFLATNNIIIRTPQGYDDGTAVFHNADSTTGTMLILNMYAISKSPSDQTRSIIYTKDNPNSCTSGKVNQNTPLFFNIVYFVKNNNLIRRVIAPSDYDTNNCDPWTQTTVTPWQIPTCTANYVSAFCKSTDEILVTGITSSDGFIIKYFTSGNIVNVPDASDDTKTDPVRQTSLNNADMITATINTSIMAAGREVNQSGTVRATKYNNIQLTSISCPTGFIVVPGSITYGTSDFCIMKYNAKADDNGDGIGDTNQSTAYNTWPTSTYPISSSRKIVSSAAGYPLGMIGQDMAILVSSTAGYVKDCNSGCHLVTEAEWMTVAQNVLSVASNWSGGTVGSGYIYSGHNSGFPVLALEADTNDANGYAGEQSPSDNQRRTLTLTNGQVIWDFAGNVYQWTTGTIGANLQPGIVSDVTLTANEWNNSALVQRGLPNNSMPASTNIPNVTSWSSTQGIGKLKSNYSYSSNRSFWRGGYWSSAQDAGILSLEMAYDNSQWSTFNGFRVAK